MPRRKNVEQSLTPLELEIMNVLWETGPANVQTVQARLT
jgi:predicted transcriptional regulator